MILRQGLKDIEERGYASKVIAGKIKVVKHLKVVKIVKLVVLSFVWIAFICIDTIS